MQSRLELLVDIIVPSLVLGLGSSLLQKFRHHCRRRGEKFRFLDDCLIAAHVYSLLASLMPDIVHG